MIRKWWSNCVRNRRADSRLRAVSDGSTKPAAHCPLDKSLAVAIPVKILRRPKPLFNEVLGLDPPSTLANPYRHQQPPPRTAQRLSD